jgi:hypothetical protein
MFCYTSRAWNSTFHLRALGFLRLSTPPHAEIENTAVGSTRFGVSKKCHLLDFWIRLPKKMLATFPSRVFLALSSSNRRRAQLQRRSQLPSPQRGVKRIVPELLRCCFRGRQSGRAVACTERGGRSLLSSNVDVDGSSTSNSFLLSSPTDDDNAGTGDGGDETEAAKSDSGNNKGTILMGGSAKRGSSLHAPRASTRATLRDAEEEREYGALWADGATVIFACSLAEPLERLQWSHKSVFLNARSD